jgi:hypothetical protein
LGPKGMALLIIHSCRRAVLRVGQGPLQACPQFPSQVFPRLSDKGISMQPGLINGLAPAGQNGLPSQNSPYVMAGRRSVGGTGKTPPPGPVSPNSLSAPLIRGSCFIRFTPQAHPQKKRGKEAIPLSLPEFNNDCDLLRN